MRRIPKRPQRLSISQFPFTPSTYPGRRPRFSFLFTRKGIYRLQLRELDDFLRRRGLPLIAERYAVLAYGSNACPGQLFEKELDNVPVIFGKMNGAQAAHARRTTQKNGNVPATLVRKEGTRSSWITLLTQEQLQEMDDTEGREHNTYALAELPHVDFFVGRRRFVPLYTYVNIKRGVMTLKGEAVSIHAMGQKRAKAVLERSGEKPAAECLDFETIEYPNPPGRFSQLIKV